MGNPDTNEFEFERLNFFKGMFTTADDWRVEQNYHRKKLSSENRVLRNMPGIVKEIVKGVEKGLDVGPDDTGTKLVVEPGAAVDPKGNLLCLKFEATLDLPDQTKLEEAKPDKAGKDDPVTVYVTIQYDEISRGFVANQDRPEYSGHKRILEKPRLRAGTDTPSPDELELARIAFKPGSGKISLAHNPDAPGINEIDLRYRLVSLTIAQADDKLKKHEKNLDGHAKELDKHVKRLDGQDNKLEAHDKALEGHDKKLDKHDRKLDEDGKELDAHAKKLDDHGLKLLEHDTKIGEEERKSVDFEQKLARLDDHSKLRSRGLHTPGIFRSELEDFLVQPAGGLNVSVHAGAALDNLGNTIVFDNAITLPVGPVGSDPELVYIVIRHLDGRPSITRTKPDNYTSLELARIDLHPGAKEIKKPEYSDNPGPNEINLRGRRWAGAVGVVEEFMSPQTLQRIIQAMEPTRRNFVALDYRFPTKSASDVRYSALTVATLARIGCLHPGQLPNLMATLADIQQDVGNEIGEHYKNVVNGAEEFLGYRSAVADLKAALRQGTEDDILNAQNALASAAQVLAMMSVENPIANAGADQTISTAEDEVTVRLDAHQSKGRGGRDIDWYLWDRGA